MQTSIIIGSIITALMLLTANTYLQISREHYYTTTELILSRETENSLRSITEKLDISRAISSIEIKEPCIPDYSNELKKIQEALQNLEHLEQLEYLQDLVEKPSAIDSQTIQQNMKPSTGRKGRLKNIIWND